MSRIEIPGRPTAAIEAVTPAVRAYIERLERDIMTDHLTGLGSKKAYDLHLHELMSLLPAGEDEKRQSTLRDLGLMVMDINGFKEVNDRFGHKRGDKLLVSAGRAISAGIRSSDAAYRIGGDEFAVLLPNPNGALSEIAERIRYNFRSMPAAYGMNIPRLDLAIGYELATQHVPAEDFFSRADSKMYADKAALERRAYGTADKA